MAPDIRTFWGKARPANITGAGTHPLWRIRWMWPPLPYCCRAG